MNASDTHDRSRTFTNVLQDTRLKTQPHNVHKSANNALFLLEYQCESLKSTKTEQIECETQETLPFCFVVVYFESLLVKVLF